MLSVGSVPDAFIEDRGCVRAIELLQKDTQFSE